MALTRTWATAPCPTTISLGAEAPNKTFEWAYRTASIEPVGFHQSVLFAFPVFVFESVAFVVLFLALGKRDFALYPAVFVVKIQRHQRVAPLFHLADQAVNLRPFQQELARACGVWLYMA